MKKSSVKTFLRYLAKNKLYTIITLSGFAVSLSFVLLLSVYIKEELSVDQFQKNKNRIYRLYREDGATFAPPNGELIKNQLPEVEAYTRLYMNGGNASVGDNKFRMDYLLADSAFFTMFSFKLESGDPRDVLVSKNQAVLSESFARKIFGDDNAVGKTFKMDNHDFNVSGIIQDMPANTHIQKFDAILKFDVLADLWGWPQLLTTNSNSSFGLYFLAKPGTDLPSKAPVILEQFKKDYWLYKEEFAKELKFEPLSEVYFSSSSGPAIKQNNRANVFTFGGIAILILVIAVINYINLTVAQAGTRSSEIAIKKLMGNSRRALTRQHISESIFMGFVAALIGIVLAFLIEPFFNTQMDSQLNLFHQFNGIFILLSLGVIVLTGFVSGIIPAIVANSFNPIDVVKGNFSFKSKGWYSKILIAFQYGIAIVLLVSTWTITRQSKYLQNYDMGFNKENLFWMDNTIESNQKEAFRSLLKTIPGVEEVSYCKGTPIDGGNNQSFSYNDKPVSFQEFVVDSLYFGLFGMEVDETGNAYSQNGIWLNKEVIRQLNLDEKPTSFKFYDQELPVLGIIEDFNFQSLYTKVGPAIVRQLKNEDYPWNIVVKLNGQNLVETVKKIKESQASFTGGVPMESGFIDDTINSWYEKEVKRSKLIGAFTLLAIIISSMGIFAMSLYYIQQKVKEIGVRKVNGAKVSEVVVLLNKGFLRWVAVAFVIATPVAWFAMNKWLENFAYKISLNWWVFALSGLFALGIALLTVSFQSWKAAIRNPVEALRHE